MASSLHDNPGEILGAKSYARLSHLTPHRNAHHIAPLPDRFVMQAIDGLVLPHRAHAGGGERGGVGGVGFVVDG